MSNTFYKTANGVDEYIKAAEGHNGQNLISELEKWLPKNSTILEIGSGPGADWQILTKHYEVTGSDNSDEFIRRLNLKFPEGNFLNLDAVTLNTKQEYNCIYSNKVLHHLKDEEIAQSVQNQNKCLAKNGLICHSFWKGEGNEVFKGLFVNYHNQNDLPLIFKGYKILVMQEYAEFEKNDSILLIAQKE